MSGPENERFWLDDGLSIYPEWDVIRGAAKNVLATFRWRPIKPAPSRDFFIVGI
jgi:hypothetical protein